MMIKGRLALKVSSHGSGPDPRGIYAAELPRLANAPVQAATDRNALYALYRKI